MKILLCGFGVGALGALAVGAFALAPQPASAALFGGPDALVPVIGCPVVPPPAPAPLPAAVVEPAAPAKKPVHHARKKAPAAVQAIPVVAPATDK